MLNWLFRLFSWFKPKQEALPDHGSAGTSASEAETEREGKGASEGAVGVADAEQSAPDAPNGPTLVVVDEEEDLETVAAPWEGAQAAVSLDAAEVAQHLEKAIDEELDRVLSLPERHFLEGLRNTVAKGEASLPPFPDVARELQRLLGQPEVTMMQVVRLVERDPALVQGVWSAASSARYAMPPKGLHFAISRIGFDELWRVALRICLKASAFDSPGAQDQAEATRLNGVVAASVAAELSGERRGSIYLSALLHDVGKLVIYPHVGPELGRTPQGLALVERIAKEHHASLGVLVARAWKMGDDVTVGIGYHHDPEQAPEAHRKLARWVQVADVIAHQACAEQQQRRFETKDVLGGAQDLLGGKGDPMEVGRSALRDASL